ncbi:unnamed protein product [Closterium sp. NIES-54]
MGQPTLPPCPSCYLFQHPPEPCRATARPSPHFTRIPTQQQQQQQRDSTAAAACLDSSSSVTGQQQQRDRTAAAAAGLDSSSSRTGQQQQQQDWTAAAAALDSSSSSSNGQQQRPAPLDLVHMDLWGPYPICSRQGHRYMLVLVDDHSRYSTVFFLHTKDQVPAVVIAWAEQCRTHFKRPISRLHSDGGGEFLNHTLATYCKTRGIQQTHTLPHSPQQNGIAESRIREITKIARCLLAHISTPLSLSSYALLHAALLLNLRSYPQHSSSSPTELWSKAKPDAAGLRVWGCKAFVLIPLADRSRAAGKLATRALECVYLGHNPDSPGYMFLHPPFGRLIRGIDVVFDEPIPYYSTPPCHPLPPPSRPLAWTDTFAPPLAASSFWCMWTT